jgi:hypothetical protein
MWIPLSKIGRSETPSERLEKKWAQYFGT